MLAPLIFKLAGLVTAAIVPTAAALGVRYLYRRGKLQLSDLEMQQISALAQEAVTAADQRYKHVDQSPDTNRQKRDFATSSLVENLGRVGIAIDRKTAENKIEVAVNRVRSREVVHAPRTPARQQDLMWTPRDP